MSSEAALLEDLSRARILIVEDELIVAKDLQNGLRVAGYTVCGTATTGAMAVSKAAELRPDVLLTDIRLRGEMDGIEAARLVREQADVCVVFLTAYADRETLRRAATIGPYAYLLKPFDDRELLGTVTMALCKHRAFAERYGRLQAVAQLGLFALEARDPQAVSRRAVEVVSETLGAEQAEALEREPDGRLAVRATHAPDLRADDASFLQAVVNLVETARMRAAAEAKVLEAERIARHERTRAKLAEEAVRARDEFLSVASHELRTPVAALQLQLETLHELMAPCGATLDPRLSERTERATVSVARLARLVESILDVSRVTLGRLVLDCDDVDLVELVRAVVARHEDLARRCGCELRCATPRPVRGRWDRGRLDQVVTNLLSNALSFGAGKPIDLAVELADEAAVLIVRDQGEGLDPSDAERILGRYERAASYQHHGGLGLGLYLAGQIVRAHGGRIDVAGRLGEGAAFTVRLPLGGDRRV